jgi:hypothetical protein
LSELPSESYECKNLRSALEDPDTVTRLINEECVKGFLIGPFEQSPFPVYRVNPIGVVTGKYSQKKRLIVDLSSPHHSNKHLSLNSTIPKEDYSLQYVRIDDAQDIILKLGKGTSMCKLDIKDAFKLLPVRPDLWPFQGIRWNGLYYFYTRLMFGSRSSPKIFDDFSCLLCWIAQHNFGVTFILHLLDDFLSLERPQIWPDKNMDSLVRMFAHLNIPLSEQKSCGPTTELEYLGIILNSERMQARLPEDKRIRTALLVKNFSTKTKCTKRELLSLIGHLAYACKVVVPGRAFLWYLLTLAKSRRELHHRVDLNAECRIDLAMWSTFLEKWNGCNFFLDSQLTVASDMHLFTDASPSFGCGGFYQGEWFSYAWPKFIYELEPNPSIALFELFPIVVSAVLWGTRWSKRRIVFHTDNAPVVEMINKGRTSCGGPMRLLRRLTLIALQHNFTMTAVHIPGRDNVIADCLSRFQIAKFRRLVPNARQQPSPLPPQHLLLYP